MIDHDKASSGQDEQPCGSSKKNSQRTGGSNEFRKMSTSGQSLYDLLDLPKESDKDEIKRKFRRLALKYHPDKNPNNPEAEEMFKRINFAHSTLTDDRKRRIYDKHGSFGLYIADQVGDEMAEKIMKFMSGWLPCVMLTCFCLTGCCFGCCCFCCCCCNYCCGKCKPKGLDDFEPDEEDSISDQDDVPITTQPTADPPTSGDVKHTESLPEVNDEAQKEASHVPDAVNESSPLRTSASNQTKMYTSEETK